MIISTQAIVISKLKYGDNDLIIKCYTEQLGVVSFLLKGVLKSKKGKAKTAYFQLLSQLQLDIVQKNNRSLQTIKDVKLKHIYSSLHTNVLKSSIVMFLAEVLSMSLQEEEKNTYLYQYLEATLDWLDNHKDYSNFHLLFLVKLTKYLGFYPDTTNINAHYFNLKNGKFQNNKTDIYSVSGKNLTVLKQFLGTTFDALSEIKMNSKERHAFLSMLLLYFELHLGSFKKPRSLEVFNQVFNV